MTEAQWLQATDVALLLNSLEGEVSDSKLRLFACACSRRIWDLIDSDLHRRAVAFAEGFAHGEGKDLLWLGSGNWTCRKLSWSVDRFKRVEGWTAITSEIAAYQRNLWSDDETTAGFLYDHCTPVATAESTLHMVYCMPAYVARGAAVVRTAPYAYWQHHREPELRAEEQMKWNARIRHEMATLCVLFRDIYGNPFRDHDTTS